MKINNKSEKTLTLYSKDLEYEVGDFVISGRTIYICNPKEGNTVIGVDPSKDDSQEYYYPYLGDNLVNLDEFLELLEKGQGKNGYIDINSLYSILNYFMDGFTSKGVIGNWINIKDSNLETNLTFSKKESILQDIMTGESNNSIYTVERSLPEIKALVKQDSNVKCLLKQYTYYEDNGAIQVRIQELIDPDQGLIFYRWIKRSINDQWPTPGKFSCSIVNGLSYKSQLEEVLTLYTTKLEYLETLESSMKENFRYRSISPQMTDRVIVLEKNLINNTNYLCFLLKDVSLSTPTSTELPILLDFEVGQSVDYRVPGMNITLTINNQSDKYTIIVGSSNIEIPSIVYREYYD